MTLLFYAFTHTHTHTHTCNMHKHTQANTRTHMHKHTHTHTWTNMYISWLHKERQSFLHIVICLLINWNLKVSKWASTAKTDKTTAAMKKERGSTTHSAVGAARTWPTLRPVLQQTGVGVAAGVYYFTVLGQTKTLIIIIFKKRHLNECSANLSVD